MPRRVCQPMNARHSCWTAASVCCAVGYAAATTDSIAREAGVSQAYVVRFFRSKETLFEEAATYVVEQLCRRFAEAPVAADSTDVERRELLGDMYAEIVKDHDMFIDDHAPIHDGDPIRASGQLSRDSFARVYRVLREDVGDGC